MASMHPYQIIKKFLLFCLKGYRLLFSPLLGENCRFYPSCSQYASEAIEQYGVWRGIGLTIKRLLKCHPGHPVSFDPVPSPTTNHNPMKSSL
jgi:uncharacterized protein